MQLNINMIGIITDDVPAMKSFYTEILGMEIILEMEDKYVEFKQNGVRFALSSAAVMKEATGQEEYLHKASGHSFELAFKVDTPEQVDEEYAKLIEKGAQAIQAPADMPWNQRTAFFADPDGNIHELFAELKK